MSGLIQIKLETKEVMIDGVVIGTYIPLGGTALLFKYGGRYVILRSHEDLERWIAKNEH